MACCPGGSAAGVVSHLAGGDVPLSVLMCTASMLCVGFTAPMLARLLVGAWLPVSATGMAITTLQVGARS